MTEGKRMLQMMKQNNKLTKKLVLSLVSLAVMAGTHAANEQFNDALRAANSGDVDLLQRMQLAQSNYSGSDRRIGHKTQAVQKSKTKMACQ